jgi:hypothetical protein
MLKILKNLIPAAVLTAGLLWTSVTASFATPEYAKKEGQSCTYCHVTSRRSLPFRVSDRCW